MAGYSGPWALLLKGFFWEKYYDLYGQRSNNDPPRDNSGAAHKGKQLAESLNHETKNDREKNADAMSAFVRVSMISVANGS